MEYSLQINQGGKSKMPRKFLRRTWRRYSKLGLRRKNKQKWRRPTGRDNKMRERRKGYPKRVEIGFGREKKLKGTINGKKLVMVNNLKDLEKIGKNEIIVLGKIGTKKKMEIVKKAEEKKLEIYRLNIHKDLKKTEELRAT